MKDAPNHQRSLPDIYADIIAEIGTQDKAASLLNVSRATINRRLRGKSVVTREHVMAAEAALIQLKKQTQTP